MSEIIQIEDGILVETTVLETDAENLSSGHESKRSLTDIAALVHEVLAPVCKSIRDATPSLGVDSATISVGIKIGTKGSLILASGTAEANVAVKVTISSKNG